MANPDRVQPDRRSVLLGAFALGAVGAGSVLTAAPAAANKARLYDHVDATRRRAGKRRLSRGTALARVAQAWAEELADSGQLRHNPRYASQIPRGWSRVAENVGQVGAGPARPEDHLHGLWMRSPGHRANILGDFTFVGIGRAFDPSGRLWGVQVFAKYP